MEWMETFTDDHKLTPCSDQGETENLAQWIHLHQSSWIYDSGKITEEGAERLYKPGYQEVSQEAASHRNGCINKTWTVAICIDKLM